MECRPSAEAAPCVNVADNEAGHHEDPDDDEDGPWHLSSFNGRWGRPPRLPAPQNRGDQDVDHAVFPLFRLAPPDWCSGSRRAPITVTPSGARSGWPAGVPVGGTWPEVTGQHIPARGGSHEDLDQGRKGDQECNSETAHENWHDADCERHTDPSLRTGPGMTTASALVNLRVSKRCANGEQCSEKVWQCGLPANEVSDLNRRLEFPPTFAPE